MLDISPSSNHRAENHESKRKEGRCSDASSKPQNLSVCNDDDCQVLENGVDWDRKELEGLGAGVDHTNQKEGDGEPCIRAISNQGCSGEAALRTCLRLFCVKWCQVCDHTQLLADHDSNNTDKRLESCQTSSLQVCATRKRT